MKHASQKQIDERKQELALTKMLRAINSPHEEHFDRARYNADILILAQRQEEENRSYQPRPHNNRPRGPKNK